MTPAQRFADAYRQMAAIGYRPGAPSDGCGHITVPLDELDLDAEAARYARRFIVEEDTRTFWLGVTHYASNRAFVWTVEAARLMCGGAIDHPHLVPELLRMAIAEYEQACQVRSADGND